MSWQDNRTFTKEQLIWHIKALDMSNAGAGRYLGASERTMRRYIRGEAPVPPAMVLLLRLLHGHKIKPVVPKWTKEAN